MPASHGFILKARSYGSSFLMCALLATSTALTAFCAAATAQANDEQSPLQNAAVARFTTSLQGILENAGQVADPVKFYLPGARSTLFFTPKEIVLNIGPEKDSSSPGDDGDERPDRSRGLGLVLRIGFDGARLSPVLEGLDEQKGTVNVINQSSGEQRPRKDIRRFAGVVYKDLYPGIDLECRAGKDGMQRTLVVKDGGKLDRVRFQYQGIEGTRLAADGQLELLTPLGVIKESPIQVRYAAKTDGAAPILARYTLQNSNIVGVETGREK